MIEFIAFGSGMIVLSLIAMAIKRWTVEQRGRFYERLFRSSAPSRRVLEVDATLGAWLGLLIGSILVVIGILAL